MLYTTQRLAIIRLEVVSPGCADLCLGSGLCLISVLLGDLAVAPDSYWDYVQADGRYSTSTLQSTEDCMPVPRLTYHVGGFGSDIKDQFLSHLGIDHQLPPKHLAIVLTN